MSLMQRDPVASRAPTPGRPAEPGSVQERTGTCRNREQKDRSHRVEAEKLKALVANSLAVHTAPKLLDVARGRSSRFPERPTGRQSLVRWDGFDICGCGTSRAGKWEAQVGVWGDVDPVALCG